MPGPGKQRTASSAPKRRKLSKRDRAFVYNRDRGVCQHCFERVSAFAYDIDHVDRVVGGGTDLISNLILAHQRCNRRRGNRTLYAWRIVLAAEKLDLEAGRSA